MQPEQALAQAEPESDPARFPAGAAQVQPSGRGAQRPLELAFPAVVRVPVERVVAEFRGRRVEQAEQPAAQRGGLPGPQRPALGQRDQVGQVGQGQAAVQQRGVRDLQRVPGLDQFRRGTAGDPGAGAEVALGGRHPRHAAPPPGPGRDRGRHRRARRAGPDPPPREAGLPGLAGQRTASGRRRRPGTPGCRVPGLPGTPRSARPSPWPRTCRRGTLPRSPLPAARPAVPPARARRTRARSTRPARPAQRCGPDPRPGPPLPPPVTRPGPGSRPQAG